MLERGSSDIWRRIRLYLFGFIMGLIGVYFMFGTRGCKWLTPGMLKLDELATKSTLQYSDTAVCEMKCGHITPDEVVEAFTYGKVDSKKSQDFHQRYPLFNFSGLTQKGRNLNVICQERDTITRIIHIKDIGLKDTCHCP